MRISLGDTPTFVETRCNGCMCHEMAMQFGSGGYCQECGCPKTVDAFLEVFREQNPLYADWGTEALTKMIREKQSSS